MTDNQAMAETLDYLRKSHHKEHVIAACLFSELQTENARLRDAKQELRSALEELLLAHDSLRADWIYSSGIIPYKSHASERAREALGFVK
jgi:hypothetical protein